MKRSWAAAALVAALLLVSTLPLRAECDPLIVRDTALEREDYDVRIVGEALHHADDALVDLTLSFALYDRRKGVGGASASRERLEAGDVWHFAAEPSTDDFTGYRLAATFCNRTSEETRFIAAVPPATPEALFPLPPVVRPR